MKVQLYPKFILPANGNIPEPESLLEHNLNST